MPSPTVAVAARPTTRPCIRRAPSAASSWLVAITSSEECDLRLNIGPFGGRFFYEADLFMKHRALATLAACLGAAITQASPAPPPVPATLADFTALIASGKASSEELTARYLARIETLDRQGPHLASVLEVQPEVLRAARQLDRERR